MAEVEGAEGNLLATKWGPLPVWVWALIGLGAAWAYAKYKSSTSAASSATTTADPTDDGEAVAPQFVIENNMPTNTLSAPVTVPTGPAAPVVTPPGTTPAPPVTTAPPKTTTPTTPTKPVTVAKPPVASKKPPIPYKVVANDNLSSIAAKYHTSAAALFTYNTTPGVRPAATIATLKSRGPNLLFPGETILIPQS